jgi:hypothetical protein
VPPESSPAITVIAITVGHETNERRNLEYGQILPGGKQGHFPTKTGNH